MKLLSYLAFIACLQGFCFAAVVWTLNPRAALNRVGTVIGLLNGWWNFCLTFVYGSPDTGTALLFDRLSYVSILGLNPFLAWFFLSFAGTSKRWVAVLVTVAFVISAVVGFEYLATGFPRAAFHPGPWGNVEVLAADQTWSRVSDVAAIGLDAVYLFLLARKRATTPSWRLKSLLTIILLGIVSAIAAYIVLGYISQTFGVPGLIFLPAAALTFLNLYVIFQYGFLKSDRPEWELELASALPQATLLLDKDGGILDRNPAARTWLRSASGNLGAILGADQTWGAAWQALRDRAVRSEATVDTPAGPVVLSPHYDRFGDFVGAVAVLGVEVATPEALTARETEVLALLAEGEGNLAIAARLFISPGTVKRHVHSILAKTGIATRQGLVVRFGGAAR